LKAELRAGAVVLMERRPRSAWSAQELPEPLTAALARVPCLPLDWPTASAELEASEECTLTCGCGERHQLHGVVMATDWLLWIQARDLLRPDGSFDTSRAAAYGTWVILIRAMFEDGVIRHGPSGKRGGGGTAGPAELGIPLWWVRKGRQ
jgi:hypothetical protein